MISIFQVLGEPEEAIPYHLRAAALEKEVRCRLSLFISVHIELNRRFCFLNRARWRSLRRTTLSWPAISS